MSNRTVFAASVLALAVLVAGGWRVALLSRRLSQEARRRQRIEDRFNLRNIVGLVVVEPNLPMKDGALDPYEFVRRGTIEPWDYGVLRSVRFGGPTNEEIGRSDYTNFPWERYRGERKLRDGLPFPLLWDKRPDADGVVLAALSDGSVQQWDQETLALALAER